MRWVSSFLVDDRGDVHLGRGAHQLFSPAADDDATSAVKEHGQIEWLAREGHVRVRLRPSMVSPPAYARLMAWLDSGEAERVLLSSFIGREWHYEYLRGAKLVAERVRQLVEQYGGGKACSLRRRTRLTTSLDAGKYAQAVEFWREHRDNFLGDETMSVLGPLLGERWVLYESLPSGRFAVRGFGPHHTPHVRKWLEAQQRAPLDTPYGDNFVSRACVRVYREVVNALEPAADELDAVSHWTGFGRMRSRYRRLMLPYRSAERCWILSGIALDRDIDLLD